MDRLRNTLNRLLNTSATPLAYLVVAYSLAFGLAFVFFGWTKTVQLIVLYQLGALVGVQFWGWMTTLGSLSLLVGLSTKSMWRVSAGSLLVFMAWTFAVIIYAQNHLWLQVVLGTINALYFVYIYLSASLGRLWNYAPPPRY